MPRADIHAHQCEECGALWEHERPPRNCTDAEYEQRHTCPTPGCGAVQYQKHFDTQHPMPSFDDDLLSFAEMLFGSSLR